MWKDNRRKSLVPAASHGFEPYETGADLVMFNRAAKFRSYSYIDFIEQGPDINTPLGKVLYQFCRRICRYSGNSSPSVDSSQWQGPTFGHFVGPTERLKDTDLTCTAMYRVSFPSAQILQSMKLQKVQF